MCIRDSARTVQRRRRADRLWPCRQPYRRPDVYKRQPLVFPDFEARLGASIGVAVFPDDAATAEMLANNADLAMYRAKADAATAPCYYDGQLDEAIRDQRELATDLRRAIDRHELDVHYQVQTSVTTGDVTGYEALLRWTCLLYTSRCV